MKAALGVCGGIAAYKAAEPVRQIQSGARPLVHTHSRKPCRIAQDEVEAGKVPYIVGESKPGAVVASEMIDQALGKR